MDEDNLEIELISKEGIINALIPIMSELSIDADAQGKILLTIMNQKVAYDIENVVAELEEEKQRLRNLKNDCIALSDSEVIAIEENAYNFAIDIVRKGGVND